MRTGPREDNHRRALDPPSLTALEDNHRRALVFPLSRRDPTSRVGPASDLRCPTCGGGIGHHGRRPTCGGGIDRIMGRMQYTTRGIEKHGCRSILHDQQRTTSLPRTIRPSRNKQYNKIDLSSLRRGTINVPQLYTTHQPAVYMISQPQASIQTRPHIGPPTQETNHV